MPTAFDTLAQWLADHHVAVAWVAALSAVAFVGSLLALPWLLARIPHDYFVDGEPKRAPRDEGRPALRLALFVGRNLLGVAFVLAGLIMLVLPGQGLLTILVGAVLADFPGKHALLRRIVAQPAVLASANWLRRRAGQPPLIVE
jgi:hypothetical protein